MAKNRSTERLNRLRKTPLYDVTAWEISWPNNDLRRDVSNSMTLLGWTDHDAPIRKAFTYFGLDERDPRHWRILMTYLAFVIFPNPKTGVRYKTLQENAELLKRCLEFPNAKNDTEILEKVVARYRKIYSKNQIPNLRKRLKVARREAARI